MLLRLSRFVHLLPVGDGRVLVVDAVSHGRLTVNDQVAAIIRDFSTPRQLEHPPPTDSLVAALLARGILTEKPPEEELSHVTGLLSPYLGRDPEVLLEQYRLKAKQGVDAYFAASVALTPE